MIDRWDLIGGVGALLVVGGVVAIYPPAGVILAGLALFVAAACGSYVQSNTRGDK